MEDHSTRFSGEEVAALVVANRAAEQQDLEFKATFEHKDPAARMELLITGGWVRLALGVRSAPVSYVHQFEDPIGVIRF